MNLKHESNESHEFYIRGHLRPSVPKKKKEYEEGELEDCDSDYRQHSDGNRDYAGSD